MNIQPKVFVALRDFAVGTESYSAGDEVPQSSPHLARLISFGGFVEHTTTKKEK